MLVSKRNKYLTPLRINIHVRWTRDATARQEGVRLSGQQRSGSWIQNFGLLLILKKSLTLCKIITNILTYWSLWASQLASGKESTCQFSIHKRHTFDPWVRKIPWRRKWQTAPVFLPGKFHGQRRLVGYSPWGHEESDMAKKLSKHARAHMHTYTHTHTHTHTLVSTPYHCPHSGSWQKATKSFINRGTRRILCSNI